MFIMIIDHGCSFKHFRYVMCMDNKYKVIEVDVQAVIDDWRGSLTAHHWLDSQGCMKPVDALSDTHQQALQDMRKRMEQGEEIEPPILGIGITDCVEIGSGAAQLLFHAMRGDTTMHVRVRPAQVDSLQKVIAK